MGRRTLNRQSITNLIEQAKEKNYQSEAERKQALKDSVKVGRAPDGYTFVTKHRNSTPSPSNFVMRWVDSKKSSGAIVTSSGRTFLP